VKIAFRNSIAQAFGLLLLALTAPAQTPAPYPTLFQPAVARSARVSAALTTAEARSGDLIQEWIRVAEIPAWSGGEQQRAAFVREQLNAMGLANVRTDEIGNVIGELPGTDAKGPVIVFAAHMDTVFAAGVPRRVRREGGKLFCPGIGDDSSGLAGLLEAFRALKQAGVRTRGKLVFAATVMEENRLRGARRLLGEIHPDMFIAVDTWLGDIWYGALRISRLKFTLTSAGGHTLFSRGVPSPARALAAAIQNVYAVPLPPADPGLGGMKVPVLNVGTLGGGTVVNAIPQEAWFTVDLRSLDSRTQDRLESEVVRAARSAAEKEGVGFRAEKPQGEDIDFSKALPRASRRADPLVQTAVDVHRHLRLGGAKGPEPMDMGSTDANVAVGLGLPAIAIGAARYTGPHTLDEAAEENSIVPGVKMLVLLAAALGGVPE
jgi:tripeptide aminopeptidase